MRNWQRLGSGSNSTSSKSDASSSKSKHSVPHHNSAPELALTSADGSTYTPIADSNQSDQHVQFDENDQISCEEQGASCHPLHTRDDDSRSSSDAATLIGEALNRHEAKNRHIQFSDHINESMSLIHNIVTGRRRSSVWSRDAVQVDDCPHDKSRRFSTSSHTQANRSGSVLGSLLRLEAQLQSGESHLERHIRRRKSSSPKYPNSSEAESPKESRTAPPSLRDDRSVYSHDNFSALDLHLPESAAAIEGSLKRPREWIKNVSSSSHLVPSLEKRKRETSSRTQGRASVFTTSSQFERVTVEDRVRIAFEIANILQRQEFLRKLTKALMVYGCPAHRLEYILKHVADTLKVNAEFVYIPNVMLMTFVDKETHTTDTHFVAQSSGFDMHKLGEIYRLEKLVGHGEVTVDEALEFLDKVANDPQFYPLWLNPFIYATLSLCGSVMFYGGRWKEAGLSSGLAMFFAVYELFSGRFWGFQPIWEITVCIIIGFVSRASTKFGFCFIPTAFASFIVILPGYSIAIAIIELVSRQLVSGVVRTGYAIIYSFLLGYGISMGSALYITIDPSSNSDSSSDCQLAANANTCIVAESQYYHLLTVPVFALAYCQLLRARLPRWPAIITVAICGFTVNWLLSCVTSAPQQVIQVVPAFTVGLIGNLLTKLTGKMSFDAVLVAIFYLVPGSLGKQKVFPSWILLLNVITGLKAAIGIFGGQANEFGSQGASFALSMIETCIGIAVGLCIANLLVYPKGAQRTPLMNF